MEKNPKKMKRILFGQEKGVFFSKVTPPQKAWKILEVVTSVFGCFF